LQATLLALEDRRLLSIFTVTSTDDSAPASAPAAHTLRWAVEEANVATSPSAIEFELGSGAATITLLQGQLELSNASDATTIYDGPGQGGVTISGNHASRVLQIDASVTGSISGVTITGGYTYGTSGSAAGDGAGLANDGGTLTMTGCTVSGNNAGGFVGGGGGINNQLGTTTLINCTVSGNYASFGGGIRTVRGTLTLEDCTVSANLSPFGSGINDFHTTLTLTNTIVAGNYHFPGQLGGDISGGPISGSDNLIGGNPLLAPLGNYGGLTQTMALLPRSPAIDAGNNALIPSVVTNDQRGVPFPRIVNGTVDIGAFESSGFAIAYTSGSGQSASGAFAAPLVATVTAQNSNEPVAGGLVTFTPPNIGASATISPNPAVIAADGTATVAATSNFIGGTYNVLATAKGAPGAASFTLRNFAVMSIAVSPVDPSLALGVAGQFTALGTFTDLSTQNLSSVAAWVSGTPSVATISGTGVATGAALGTSQITASWQGVTSPDDTLHVIAPSFVVNTTADEFGFYTGTTSLREAIASANAVPGQTITFDKKVFKTPQTIDLNPTLGQLELSDATGTTTITGPTATARVTIDAGGNSRVFAVDPNVTASISGMTITGGSAYNGGGLANYGGTLSLTNCTISGNSAHRYGEGGGLVNYFGSNLTLTGCTVSGNSAFRGGGVYNQFVASVTVENSTFKANHASGFGGAIDNSGHLDFLDSGFTGNSAGNTGGAVSNSSGGTGSISGCRFAGNHAGSTGGGGISVFSGALTIVNTSIDDNSAAGNGGGLRVGGSATLTNCTISGNTAGTSGGGVYLTYSGGTATLTDCTVSGNSAGTSGGGLAVGGSMYGSSATATLNKCTVSGNTAAQGGGLFNAGTLSVASSNITGNTATSAGGGISTTGVGSTATITNSVVNSNRVNSTGTALGGGVDCENSTLSLSDCNVNANQANGVNAKGGGIYALDSTVNVANSTVNGNQANGSVDGEGGGIYAWDAALSLVSSNVKGNKASTNYNDLFPHP
jgi:CSLREA domain-containing protein